MNGILQNKILLAIIGVVVAGAAAYGVYSLTQSDSDTDSTGDSVQADIASNNTNDDQANSGDQTTEGRLVDGFPGDKIPLYLGEVVRSKRSTDSQGRTEYTVRITTTDSFEKVDNWTRTSYVNEGWDIRNDNTTPLGGFLITARSDEYINSITYNELGGTVTIDYGITKI